MNNLLNRPVFVHTLGPAVAGGYTIGPCTFVNVIFRYNAHFFVGVAGVGGGLLRTRIRRPVLMSMAAKDNSRWNFLATIGAWLFPGLGYFLMGERKRAAILAVSIGLLWLLGILIGGVSVVDRRQHPAWFLGQMLVAPSLAVDYYQQRIKQDSDDPTVIDLDQGYEPSYGHISEQGILYTALAGLLNLLAMIDVIYRMPTGPRQQEAEQGLSATAGDNARGVA